MRRSQIAGALGLTVVVALGVYAALTSDAYPTGYSHPAGANGTTECDSNNQPVAEVNIRLLPDSGMIPPLARRAIRHERKHRMQRDSFPGGCREYEKASVRSKTFRDQQENEAQCAEPTSIKCAWVDSVKAAGQWRWPATKNKGD